jgi:hypothetical protein
MKRIMLLVVLLLLITGGALAQPVSPAPALLNFQGRLTRTDGSLVPNGNYSIRFSLWSAAIGGAERWNQTINPVAVRNGTFTALLNVANPATLFAVDLWLEIQIGSDAPLTPRQQLVSVAYAMKANTVPDGAIGTNQLANNAVTNAKIASNAITSSRIADGTITAADFAPNIFNPLAWLLDGNSGTDPANHFLGTTDNQPLNVRVNNQRAYRLEYARFVYNAASNLYYEGSNVLGGYSLNSITSGVVAGTIAGGGFLDSSEPIQVPNRVTDFGGTVGGGAGNLAGDNAGTVDDRRLATVGGGYYNAASRSYASILGGYLNAASADYATVGGGFSNQASGAYAFVGGGQLNIASGSLATIGGGNSNLASTGQSTVAGGNRNQATNEFSTVGGGESNVSSGYAATVPGGIANAATGFYSFAAGRRAKANHNGTFVWGDGADADFASTAVNQFLIRAGGGVGINTGSPTAGTALDVNGLARMTGFRLPTGAAAGRVLTSDASGNGTWAQIGSSSIATNTFSNATAFNLWSLNGNAGTSLSNFLGTTDNQPLNLRANNQRGLHLSYASASAGGNTYIGHNLIGGFWLNSVTAGVVGATIAGGGVRQNAVDLPNRVTDIGGTVGGGLRNQAGDNDADILDAAEATVGGGVFNVASGQVSTVGGGSSNIASGLSSTIPGGSVNLASGQSSVVGGGSSNAALGEYATVPGGQLNVALGDFSLAAGMRARADHDGTFVWADATNVDFASTSINAFLIRAASGVGINTNDPRAPLHLLGSAAPPAGLLAANNGLLLGSNGTASYKWIQSYGGPLVLNSQGNNVGIGLNNPTFKLHVNGSVAGVGNYNNLSDARYKRNVATLDNALDTILHLRGVTFDWKRDTPGMNFTEGRQIGFLAQEVEQILPELVTTDSRGYKSVAYANVVPVLVEAIKTLKKDYQAIQAENAELKARMKRLEALEEAVAQLKAERK